jgi:EmrB/QacA subfamily drug resistance transporter
MNRDSAIYPWLVFSNVLLMTLIAVYLALATFIPNSEIIGELALSDTLSLWISLLNLLGVNITVPLTGYLVERYGLKTVFLWGIGGITFGSLLVATTTGFMQLALGRTIEGLGGGLIFPTGLTILSYVFPKEKRRIAANLYFLFSFGGGTVLAGNLVGAIAESGHWRMVFWPVVAAGGLGMISTWILNEETEKREGLLFDFWGYLALIILVSGFLVGMMNGNLPSVAEGWRSPLVLGSFAIAFVSLICLIAIEKKHPTPILPISLFQDPIFALVGLNLFVVGLSLFSSSSMLISLMMEGLHFSRTVTGQIAGFYGLSLIFGSGLSILLGKKWPPAALSFCGICFLLFSFSLNAQVTHLTGEGQMALLNTMRGIGQGLILGPITGQGILFVPKERAAEGATVLTFLRQVGGTIGAAIASMLVIRRDIFHTARFGEQTTTQIPGYEETFQTLTTYLSQNTSPQQAIVQQQAEHIIIKSVHNQSFITSTNDVFVLFAYITLITSALLFGAIAIRSFTSAHSPPKT